MKKVILIFSLILLLTVFSIASTITVWFSWEGQKEFQSIVNEFHLTHPNIRVNLVYIPNMIQKLRITLASNGSFPDVALVRNDDLGMLTAANVIKPVKGVKTADVFYRSFLVNKIEYAYPYYADIQVVYINKALFNGIPIPKSSWTLSDFEKTAEVLKNNGHIGVLLQKSSPYFFDAFNAAFNNGIIPEKNGIPWVNTPGTLKAAKLYNYLFNERKIAVSYEKMALVNAFKTQKAGMFMMGSFLIPDFLNLNLDFTILPYPSLDNGKPIPPVLDSKGFVIFNDNPSAKKFLDYVTSAEMEEKFCGSTYKLPANENAMRSLGQKNAFFKTMSLSAKNALVLPSSKAFKELYGKAVSTTLNLYLSGEMPLEEAFRKAQEYISHHK